MGAVAAGEGAGFVVELQPGLAKMRMRANTWTPTTRPKIFRIFIVGEIGKVVMAREGECYPKFPAGSGS